ncbi:hypothetical protein FNV43_RR27217 [Rhamnella rubrinervis]|uniref:Anamorsin homolog n=1 Tax=Rhamnella rubrinervis TaxID=2594499 RepID=A0A8K0GKE1_9ROSA|nr:hypothetical protein FNV43_RR27217 [Rhamnella rubrinervis]
MVGKVLAFTEDAVLPVSTVFDIIRELADGGVEKCDPQIITQVSSLNQLPLESSSMEVVIFLCRLIELPSEHLLREISRVLKPDGTVLLVFHSQSAAGATDKTSALERQLLLVGFLEAKVLQLKLNSASDGQFFTVKARKPSWKIGSSFSLKKSVKTLPKVQIDDDLDLIDEDSLLTDEDLKKPQLPLVGDCEVGSTRKACKNCTCGRAEAEQEVQKLGLIDDLLDNPQSACGSCGLGDAFRCSTCPYKGLPPFKLGEKDVDSPLRTGNRVLAILAVASRLIFLNDDSPCYYQFLSVEYLQLRDLSVNLPTYGRFSINASFFKNFDNSNTEVRLIASVPGYHMGTSLKMWGHMKLCTVLQDCTFDKEFRKSPLFSSLGSLDEKWMAELASSMSSGLSEDKTPLGLGEPLIVWPTVEDVRCSLEVRSNMKEGYVLFKLMKESRTYSGNVIPSPLKNAEKTLLKKYWAKWKARHTGHCWFLLASENLNKAAWGGLQKNNSQLMIRSYEEKCESSENSRERKTEMVTLNWERSLNTVSSSTKVIKLPVP